MAEKSTVFLSENLKFYKNKTNEGDCTILVMIYFSVPFKAPDIFSIVIKKCIEVCKALYKAGKILAEWSIVSDNRHS